MVSRTFGGPGQLLGPARVLLIGRAALFPFLEQASRAARRKP